MTFKCKTLSVSLAQTREDQKECLEYLCSQKTKGNVETTGERSLVREIQCIPGVRPIKEVTTITIKLDKIASDNILSAKLALQLGCKVVGADDPEDEVICNG